MSMYNAHFAFSQAPFSISPDPSFLYLSDRHRDALAHLVYGAGENGGFVLLTGQVGSGKTTLVRAFLEQHINNIEVALCLYSGLSVEDFLASVLDELGISYPKTGASIRTLLEVLNDHLLKTHAAGRETVIIVDEAQNLSREVLEQIRMLTNLETNSKKLLRIILVGQEELGDMLGRADLRQLAQRVTTRYHLTALTSNEVEHYIHHRLKVVRGSENIFPVSITRKIHQLTNGVPRLINTLCDKALLCAYSDNALQVSNQHIHEAEKELFFHDINSKKSPKRHSRAALWLMPLLVIACAGAAFHFRTEWMKLPFYQYLQHKFQEPALSKTAETIPNTTSQRPHDKPVIDALSRPLKTASLTVAPVKELANIQQDSIDTENSSSKNRVITNIDDWFNYPKSELEAMFDLLKVWPTSVDLSLGKSPCQVLKKEHMICLEKTGSFQMLKAINRPANIELQKSLGQSTWITVRAIKNSASDLDLNSMVLLIQDGRNLYEVSLSSIAVYWTGRFTTLLNAPNLQIKMLPGHKGNQTKWVRQRIAIANGKDFRTVSNSPIYDAELVQAVKQFQNSYQLLDDGIVGSDTLLYLYNVVAPTGTPLLYSLVGGN